VLYNLQCVCVCVCVCARARARGMDGWMITQSTDTCVELEF